MINVQILILREWEQGEKMKRLNFDCAAICKAWMKKNCRQVLWELAAAAAISY